MDIVLQRRAIKVNMKDMPSSFSRKINIRTTGNTWQLLASGTGRESLCLSVSLSLCLSLSLSLSLSFFPLSLPPSFFLPSFIYFSFLINILLDIFFLILFDIFFFILLDIFFIYISNSILEVPYIRPLLCPSLPTHSHFLALAFPCTGAYTYYFYILLTTPQSHLSHSSPHLLL
jgi:hypothetical protein